MARKSVSNPVTAEEVLRALYLQRITAILNTQTQDCENHYITGFLRGFSDDWLIIQEEGDKAEAPEKLTLVNYGAIQIVRKALPIER